MLSSLIVLLLVSVPVQAQTTLRVRAVSHDAKIIGSGVQGANITVTEVETGRILASGVQLGSTGNTGMIMGDVVRRATRYDTEGAAHVDLALDIDEPVLVEVTAEGPLKTPNNMMRASKTIYMIPGRDILGEGLIVELNGFTVEIEDPGRLAAGAAATVTAHVTMLCGCPTEPGGMWDSDNIEIVLQLLDEGEIVQTVTMEFAGRRSTYVGRVGPLEAGVYQARVIAADVAAANTGLDSIMITVR